MKKRYGFLIALVIAVGLSVVGVNAIHKKESAQEAEKYAKAQKVSNNRKEEVWDDLEDKLEDKVVLEKPVQKVKEEVSKEVQDIGREEAKEKAFAHAKVEVNQVRHLEIERDYDNGRWEYSVEFKVGNKEYDYEIDAASGNVLDFDVEVDD